MPFIGACVPSSIDFLFQRLSLARSGTIEEHRTHQNESCVNSIS